ALPIFARWPDGSREVFVLREVQGLDTAETAQSLGISEDAVKTRLSRAKASLRRDLWERAGRAARAKHPTPLETPACRAPKPRSAATCGSAPELLRPPRSRFISRGATKS